MFDRPDAPRPDPDTPAPVRFLPEYDNILLSHADRGRFGYDRGRRDPGARRTVHGTVLDDGRLAATWHLARDGRARAILFVAPLPHVKTRAFGALAAEAARFLAFYASDADEQSVEISTGPAS